MTHRFLSRTPAIVVLFILSCGGVDAPVGIAAEKPNIVLVMADDQGWGDAGYNGPGDASAQAKLHDTASNAVRFIRETRGRPFYVNVGIHESHAPHVPAPESVAQWKHLDEQKQVYAAVITDGDNDVGQVLAALKETGVEDNTIVIFSSDNGPEWTGAQNYVGSNTTFLPSTSASPRLPPAETARGASGALRREPPRSRIAIRRLKCCFVGRLTFPTIRSRSH